jgi:hypothetical protein
LNHGKHGKGTEEGSSNQEERTTNPHKHHERALPRESPKGYLPIGTASDQKASSARGAHAMFVPVCVGSWLNPSFRALSVFSVVIFLSLRAQDD